jgi:hypothetical protein
MIVRGAACVLAALAVCGPAGAQSRDIGAILSVAISESNPRPTRPKRPVNNLQDLMIAWAGCWSPPPADRSRQPIDVTFQFSFKRSGELFGKPRTIDFSREVTSEERERYYQAVAEAVELCSQMPFTDSMGGAVAGRPFRINLQDRRDSRRTESPWPTMTTG